MLGVSHLLGEVEDWPVIPGMFGNMQLDMAVVQGTVGGLSISPPLPGDEEGWFGTLTNPGGGPSTTVEGATSFVQHLECTTLECTTLGCTTPCLYNNLFVQHLECTTLECTTLECTTLDFNQVYP